MVTLISERPQCESVRAYLWLESPHEWHRCKNAASEDRNQTAVCSTHAICDVLVRYDTPEESRPSWRTWYS